MKNKFINTLLFFSITISLHVVAKVKPAALFTNNMVIQQQSNAAIWGEAKAQEKIVITASWGENSTVYADDSGKWQTTISTPEATKGKQIPYTIEFKGSNTVTINNVLVGEVWLASGQSNMDFTITDLKLSKQQVGARNFQHIREFTVQKHLSKNPVDNVTGSWIAASEQSVLNFSATAYFFAREVHIKTGLPVGIINASWGGTPIESWLSQSAQSTHKPTQKRIEQLNKNILTFDEIKQNKIYKEKLSQWQTAKTIALINKTRFKQRKPKLVIRPDRRPHYPSNLYNGMIHPVIPYEIKGVIWYQGESNSKSLEKANFYQTQLTSLINNYRTDFNNKNLPVYVVQLANYRKAQVNPVEVNQYWPNTRESMRKATQALANADIAVAIDIGDASDIHPQNKMELGRRLSLLALRNEYAQDIVASGPKYQSAQIIANKIVLKFTEVGSGLTAKNNKPLTGFAVAGADGNYVWANAVILSGIEDDTQFVEVSSPNISKPKLVKYGWADNPSHINLYNKEGLPASPFSSE